jgi:hypothetical protein
MERPYINVLETNVENEAPTLDEAKISGRVISI